MLNQFNSGRNSGNKPQMRSKPQQPHLALLDSLLKITENKKCFDCPAKLPSYVNLTVGVFICARCSGIVREFGHRVKSIHASHFSAPEVTELAVMGNKVASTIWMATHWEHQPIDEKDSDFSTFARRRSLELTSSNDFLFRAEMKAKYVDKRYYDHVAADQPRHLSMSNSKCFSSVSTLPEARMMADLLNFGSTTSTTPSSSVQGITPSSSILDADFLSLKFDHPISSNTRIDKNPSIIEGAKDDFESPISLWDSKSSVHNITESAPTLIDAAWDLPQPTLTKSYSSQIIGDDPMGDETPTLSLSHIYSSLPEIVPISGNRVASKESFFSPWDVVDAPAMTGPKPVPSSPALLCADMKPAPNPLTNTDSMKTLTSTSLDVGWTSTWWDDSSNAAVVHQPVKVQKTPSPIPASSHILPDFSSMSENVWQ